MWRLTLLAGMFLWACLVLNYLSANFFFSSHEFMDAVNSLPHELSALYIINFVCREPRIVLTAWT